MLFFNLLKLIVGNLRYTFSLKINIKFKICNFNFDLKIIISEI